MIPLLPPKFDCNNPDLLKQTLNSARALGELKGTMATIPNENILLDTLIFTEAKSSSAIENIITTYDELFLANIDARNITASTKEAKNYAEAVRYGYYEILKKTNLLTINNILKIQAKNAPQYAVIRKMPGTVLKHGQTGETIYTPPQKQQEILTLLNNLEKFINDPTFWQADPLIKMAVIHHQFESIHPFHDGNGRIGRILNILYLTQQQLLPLPILYLSEYIIKHKPAYYRLLQEIRTKNNWLEWCIWLLKGVEETAPDTTQKVIKIKTTLQDYKTRIRACQILQPRFNQSFISLSLY